ncbi:uncharacterized protein LOC123312151 [Coccinella septempunctata]|uniref:uncharacterized protein LOC123312151 n=1 Tax=Coccinella septempunctata TaxID=41139 RepID=UPI001D092409|nr:uncharacterized protein LOC123312151 [Coccinella septempunctata]
MFRFVILIIALIFLYSCDGLVWPDIKTCDKRFHFWQPFYGSIPMNAFIAGTDKGGEKKYIARVISPDSRSWSAPTTFAENSRHIFFSWENHTEKVDRYIEIMSVSPGSTPGFGWRDSTKDDLEELRGICCLVQGGTGYLNKRKVVSYVGRTLTKGKYFVGGVYRPEWRIFETVHPMRYVDEVGRFFGLSDGFEVLAYDCCDETYCKRPNKADCCYDILI